MIRILLLVIACNHVSFGQLTDFKDPRVLEQKRLRAAYKSNNVQIRRTFEFKNPTDAESDGSGTLKEIDSLDQNGFLVCAKDILGPGRQTTMLQQFDTLGNLLWFKHLINGKQNDESRFYYDKDGNLLSRVVISSSGKIDSLIQKERIQFVDDKKITTNAAGAFAAKTIEEFDNRTGLYRSTTLSQNGQPIQITEIELNDKGQFAKETYVKSLGSKVYSTIYSYNKDGLPVEKKSYDRNNMLIYATKNEYDNNGLLVKEIELNFTGEISKLTVYKYTFYKK
jgi:hypothetical protein